MKESTWEVEIDSDLGPLKVNMTYQVDPGSHGDYYTPGEEPSVSIIKIEFEPVEVDELDLDEYEQDIMNWEYEDRSEDYYDKTER
tara:strand:- start:1600 stop:1854 length:255 start_codon:yes stop_codon:yes gene_type:complete